jgi:hypothetical protein
MSSLITLSLRFPLLRALGVPPPPLVWLGKKARAGSLASFESQDSFNAGLQNSLM